MTWLCHSLALSAQIKQTHLPKILTFSWNFVLGLASVTDNFFNWKNGVVLLLVLALGKGSLRTPVSFFYFSIFYMQFPYIEISCKYPARRKKGCYSAAESLTGEVCGGVRMPCWGVGWDWHCSRHSWDPHRTASQPGAAAVTQEHWTGLLKGMTTGTLAYMGMAVPGLNPQQGDPDGLSWTPFLYSWFLWITFRCARGKLRHSEDCG